MQNKKPFKLKKKIIFNIEFKFILIMYIIMLYNNIDSDIIIFVNHCTWSVCIYIVHNIYYKSVSHAIIVFSFIE